MRRLTAATAGLIMGLMLAGPGHADGIGARAKKAVDPDCTVSKAAKGAATKAVVGIGNRCGAAETTRDTLGIDDRDKKKGDEGLLKKRRKN